MEELLRELVPQVVATLSRRYGQFDACEDATQEAVIAALGQWPVEGVPSRPRAWLLTVAHRQLIDQWRSDNRRRHREERATREERAADEAIAPPADEQPPDSDDTLSLVFMCCHPVLPPTAQVALTLRAVGGLTTKEIAAAFLVPEATMAKRITRAKHTIAAAQRTFELPPTEDLAVRVQAVLSVLYLIFNEGYTASSGPILHRIDLSTEAIRLTRLLARLLPTEGEVVGLLALMLLTDARRPARTGDNGELIPLEDQDRSRWDAAEIQEGLELLAKTLGRHPVGPYQLQAAIAAVHDEAPTAAATDWPQILALYETLEYVAPGPMVRLSRAVAVANVRGPRAGLALLGTLAGDDPARRSHRFDAVRGHLLELAGDREGARAAYLRAARSTASVPEQNYLHLRASKLATQ
ncbi:RNA polymerase sigma factor (sigma-70 family) [Kribbella sp. VKM Ac-2527]|uniref:RNA polymerase sigma factor (Sigma-70 family) n=1 Tax=Kribbella caucasensis TaxID=2512215 RepID=A0A4R6J5N9_9ACTN|nr:sigma-70 family RNA polymerase sigma factor [Kribbella sp. VKM Ac-2527]TDO30739.1 RNA polymerase sigma factor (sigma-70 family) [Kribbella sp. VKM Ac-2527]